MVMVIAMIRLLVQAKPANVRLYIILFNKLMTQINVHEYYTQHCTTQHANIGAIVFSIF